MKKRFTSDYVALAGVDIVKASEKVHLTYDSRMEFKKGLIKMNNGHIKEVLSEIDQIRNTYGDEPTPLEALTIKVETTGKKREINQIVSDTLANKDVMAQMDKEIDEFIKEDLVERGFKYLK